MKWREEQIGDCRLILGDCLEVLPTLGKVDAVVTDAPYGIGMDGGKIGRAEYEKLGWDAERPSSEMLLSVATFAPEAIVWGGNYFADALPAAGKWLVWDKRNDPTTFADCELAWTSLCGATRMFRWLWSGPYMQQREERWHPTQKPVKLMEWCLGFVPNAQTILDPYAGSGTTGVACVKLGRKFIGVEIEERYFQIACERIYEATRQPRLDLPEPKKPEQQVMEGL